jgi:hypothetical protein
MKFVRAGLPSLFWSTTVLTIERINTGRAFFIIWCIGDVVKLLFDRGLFEILIHARIMHTLLESSVIFAEFFCPVVRSAGTAAWVWVYAVAVFPFVFFCLDLRDTVSSL